MGRIHSVIISFERQELTRIALESYLDTVTLEHSIVIVDNGSPAETQSWLASLHVPVLLMRDNLYPGKATNIGWSLDRGADYLHRIDNDIEFLPGWCDAVEEAFSDARVGQVGLTADGDEKWTCMKNWPVGGNSIIRRQLYDDGLRYDERPWEDGYSEDHPFWRDVQARGWISFFTTPCIRYLDTPRNPHPSVSDEYRRKSHADRGLMI